MVHTRKSQIKKLNIKLLDNMALLFDWEIVEKKGEDYRMYRRGNIALKFTKISPFGYKVIHYRDGNIIFSDVASHKEMGMSLLGEALGFERW